MGKYNDNIVVSYVTKPMSVHFSRPNKDLSFFHPQFDTGSIGNMVKQIYCVGETMFTLSGLLVKQKTGSSKFKLPAQPFAL